MAFRKSLISVTRAEPSPYVTWRQLCQRTTWHTTTLVTPMLSNPRANSHSRIPTSNVCGGPLRLTIKIQTLGNPLANVRFKSGLVVRETTVPPRYSWKAIWQSRHSNKEPESLTSRGARGSKWKPLCYVWLPCCFLNFKPSLIIIQRATSVDVLAKQRVNRPLSTLNAGSTPYLNLSKTSKKCSATKWQRCGLRSLVVRRKIR